MDEKMELSFKDLEQVSGGGPLEIYYNWFKALGGEPTAVQMLREGKSKKQIVYYICDFMTKYAPPEQSARNKDYSQKAYGMLPLP